jgi:fumarate hydratase class I
MAPRVGELVKALEYPFTEAAVTELKAGDQVRVSGLVFTARDRLHAYLSKGGQAPVNLRDGAIYHCGPVVVQQGGAWVVKAAGPTTSIREEPYMAGIIQKHGLRVIIGKGGMGRNTRNACMEHGCVYVQTVGGAAGMLAGRVERVGAVHMLQEFGSAEAVWEFVVRDLPGVVAIDSHGNSLYEKVQRASARALRRLMRRTA